MVTGAIKILFYFVFLFLMLSILFKMSLEPIRYGNRQLSIIDQLLLPQKLVYMDIKSVKEGWHSIKNMNTRGLIMLYKLYFILYFIHKEGVFKEKVISII